VTTFGYVIPSFGPFIEPTAFTDLVQAGEELGYHDVWFGDHVVVPGYATHLTRPDWIDPLAACAFVLGRTSRIRVGTDVLVAPYRHPALVAKMVASVDRVGDGRITLGVGTGYLRGEFAILGLDPAERGEVTDEFLDVVRLLWDTEGPASYRGSHFQFDDAVFGPAPRQDPMPLWVGGNGPRALHRAATKGNGWHPLFPTPEGYAASKAVIESELPPGAPFTFSYSCAVTTLLDTAPSSFATGSWGETGAIPDDFLYAPPLPAASDGRPRFLGLPETVAADIDQYVAAGVEHFTLRFANGGPEVGVDQLLGQMQRFMDEVVPRLGS
jgi:probable F420-dependent oxidoreductase